MHALGQLGHLILAPLYYAVSAVLLAWHWFFSLFMNPNSGGAWVLSIIGLTLVVRAALIPLFVKQIKSSRNMQLIQPRVKELQKKYGHDRERLAQETMALYKETGTNPFSACLPLLVQTPVFIALFRLLDQAYKHGTANGFMTPGQAYSLGHAKLFGTIPISATFLKPFAANSDVKILGVQVLAAILVVAMTVTTFTTQRQLMSKNMPADAMSGQYAQQQKLLLYVLPVVFAVGGIAFPIGVLFYWTTTNLWTMGQQFYVIRRNPAPGTPAFDAKVARDRARGRTTELSQELAVEEAHGDKRPEQEKPRQRQQPQKQSREKRKKGKKPGQPGSGRPQAGGAGQAGGGAADDPGTSAADDDDTDQGKSA